MRCCLICPQDMWQLFHPFSLHIIQHLLESTHYDLIDSLGLSIPLWISWGGIPIRNSRVTIVFPEGFAIKLKTIIRDEDMGDPKPSDNIFPNKSLSIHVLDICQWFSFNPLGEVIRADQQPSLIPYCLREMSYNIQISLNEWPKTGQRIRDSPWLVNVWCKFLTLVTLLHILLRFLLHVRPLVSLSESSVRQRPASYVASTDPFM